VLINTNNKKNKITTIVIITSIFMMMFLAGNYRGGLVYGANFPTFYNGSVASLFANIPTFVKSGFNISDSFLPTSKAQIPTPTINMTSSNETQQHEQGLHLENYHGVNKGDYFYIMGEVINNSSDTLNFVKVSTKLFDKDHHFIGTYFTYADDLQLGPYKTSTFKSIIGDTDVFTSVDDIAYYQMSVSGRVVEYGSS